MNNALSFARTANDLDDRLPKGRGDCFDFGIWFGCKVSCPVFLRGDCKLEDQEAMAEMVNESEDLSDVEISEIANRYKDFDVFISLLKKGGEE